MPSSRSWAISTWRRRRALVTQLFGDWKSPSAYTRVPDPFRPNQPAALRIVVPDKANAFLVGVERIPVDDLNPDYPALLVMSFILGDSSSARIPDRLRQKDGLSYGAGTVFQPSALDANSAIATYAIFAPENLASRAHRLRGGVRPRGEGRLHRRRGRRGASRACCRSAASAAPRTAASPAH